MQHRQFVFRAKHFFNVDINKNFLMSTPGEKRRSTPGDKWRSTPGDKCEVEMEVDTRRKASVTLSTKISAAISAGMSAKFTQISNNFQQIAINFKLGD